MKKAEAHTFVTRIAQDDPHCRVVGIQKYTSGPNPSQCYFGVRVEHSPTGTLFTVCSAEQWENRVTLWPSLAG